MHKTVVNVQTGEVNIIELTPEEIAQAKIDEQRYALESQIDPTEGRRAAYQLEADPLFFKAQRGEVTMEEWLSKVAEIKARFPMNP